MGKVVLTAQNRKRSIGKNESKRLRNMGIIPGILYANGNSVPIQVATKEISSVVKEHGENAILELSVEEGEKQQVFIKEIQRDTIKNELLHVDFQPIAMNEAMQLNVPIQIEGQYVIEQKGGIIQRQLNEIEIEALPNDIPKFIEIDISNLDIGDNLQVESIQAPTGVRILTSPEEVILSVSQPDAQDPDQEDIDQQEEVSGTE